MQHSKAVSLNVKNMSYLPKAAYSVEASPGQAVEYSWFQEGFFLIFITMAYIAENE